MNFIKTLKFSVKGIDTTRYIPRASARGISAVLKRQKMILIPSHPEQREESPNIGKGKQTPFEVTPGKT